MLYAAVDLKTHSFQNSSGSGSAAVCIYMGPTPVHVHGLSLSGCVVQRILDISQNITWDRYTDDMLVRPAEPEMTYILNAWVRHVACVLLDDRQWDSDIHW